METETILRISCPPNFGDRLRVEHLAAALCEEARRRGGAGYAQWVERRVRVRLQRFREAELTDLLDAFDVSTLEKAGTVSMMRTTVPAMSLPDGQSGPIEWGMIAVVKLTRSLLQRLPEGCCVVSGLRHHDGSTLFAGQIGCTRSRAALWEHAKLKGAAGRGCRLVWDQIDLADVSDGAALPPPRDINPPRG